MDSSLVFQVTLALLEVISEITRSVMTGAVLSAIVLVAAGGLTVGGGVGLVAGGGVGGVAGGVGGGAGGVTGGGVGGGVGGGKTSPAVLEGPTKLNPKSTLNKNRTALVFTNQ